MFYGTWDTWMGLCMDLFGVRKSSQMPGKSRKQPVEIQILGMFNGCWHHDVGITGQIWRMFGVNECTPCLSGSANRTFLLLSSFFSISCAGNRSMGKTWNGRSLWIWFLYLFLYPKLKDPILNHTCLWDSMVGSEGICQHFILAGRDY